MTERELLVDCLHRLNGAAITYYLTGSMASNYWVSHARQRIIVARRASGPSIF